MRQAGQAQAAKETTAEMQLMLPPLSELEAAEDQAQPVQMAREPLAVQVETDLPTLTQGPQSLVPEAAAVEHCHLAQAAQPEQAEAEPEQVVIPQRRQAQPTPAEAAAVAVTRQVQAEPVAQAVRAS